MTREEMWEEFENQLKSEVHTPITISYSDSIRLAELGIKEIVAKWKARLEQEPKTDGDCISRKALFKYANNLKDGIGITANDIARFPSIQPTAKENLVVEDCISRKALFAELNKREIPYYAAINETIKNLPSVRPKAEQEPCEDMERKIEKEYLFESLCEDLKKLQAENENLRNALKQEPKTDCDNCDYKEWIKGEIEPKTGHWLSCTVSSGRDSWQCSECGRRARGKIENLPYCHCGAKMLPTDSEKE